MARIWSVCFPDHDVECVCLFLLFSHCASSPIVILIYDAGDDARTKKMRRSNKEQ